MEKDSTKSKLALIFSISFLCINYLFLVLYSLAWLHFGWAANTAYFLKQHSPGNMFLQLVEFFLFFFIVYSIIAIIVSVIKNFLYRVTGLRKTMFAPSRLEMALTINKIPILRRKVKVTPLIEYDRALYGRLFEWAKVSGNDIKEIVVLHTKHYSRETNAFFQGSKVILVDASFDFFTHSEIEAIIAHEFGHKHDLIRTLSTRLLRVIGAIPIAAWGVWYVTTYGSTASIPVTILLITLYWFFTMIFDNVISKYGELFADTYAVLHISNKEDFKNAICRLAADNYLMMSPPGIIEFLFSSHPSPAKRLANAESLIKTRVNMIP